MHRTTLRVEIIQFSKSFSHCLYRDEDGLLEQFKWYGTVVYIYVYTLENIFTKYKTPSRAN